MKKWFLLIMILFVSFSYALAVETKKPESSGFGIGFQASFPAWGVSAMLDLGKELTAQGIYGEYQGLKSYTGRGLYYFSKKSLSNTYVFGMINSLEGAGYEWSDETNQVEKFTERISLYGGGIGIEYNMKTFIPGVTALWCNLEVGFMSAGSLKNWIFPCPGSC